MASNDIFQKINALDAEAIQRVVDRLEYRGKYAPFVQMREAYLERLNLASTPTVLAAESYSPMTVKAGTASVERAERWLIASRESSADGTFFASCNYYTYLARRPE